jgi:hypothetical protein
MRAAEDGNDDRGTPTTKGTTAGTSTVTSTNMIISSATTSSTIIMDVISTRKSSAAAPPKSTIINGNGNGNKTGTITETFTIPKRPSSTLLIGSSAKGLKNESTPIYLCLLGTVYLSVFCMILYTMSNAI